MSQSLRASCGPVSCGHQVPGYNQQAHEGAGAAEEAARWEEERRVSRYADGLPLLEQGLGGRWGRAIPADPALWACDETGVKENLWLNLSTGFIGSGRQVWLCCFMFTNSLCASSSFGRIQCMITFTCTMGGRKRRLDVEGLPGLLRGRCRPYQECLHTVKRVPYSIRSSSLTGTCMRAELGRQRRQRRGAAPLRGDGRQVPAGCQAGHHHAARRGRVQLRARRERHGPRPQAGAGRRLQGLCPLEDWND